MSPPSQPYNQTSVNSPARSSLLVVAALWLPQPSSLVSILQVVYGKTIIYLTKTIAPPAAKHRMQGGIWGSKNKIGYGIFMFFNSLGFKLSFHTIHILTPKFPLKPELILCFLAIYTTYDTAVIAITPDGMRLFVNLTTAILPAVIALTAYCLRQFRKRLTERSTRP